ncbi:trk system potassium uptake protein TrkA [Arthrobacter globiformis]|uniref:potassium channel family protein n=1 Tax=Arthrobacter globiformis TaxID=1665 RepID=UPI002784B2AB|nr:TrkA family potassium uptake protein [Arthrobacter globiformis]MDQ1057969.1 trk system potassium uptake protein TrkA [Arthrobacter globiformis]
MKVVIVGAGSVGSSIARELLSHKHEILLIDLKPEVIGRSGLRGAHWLVGDACELSTLQDAKLEDADVVVSATGDDKVNLVVSLLAKTEFGIGRTVGRVNNPKNDWMFNDSWGVDVAVNTPQLMTALVEEAVEIGDLVRLLTLQTGVSSLVEFTVPHDSHAIGLTVGDIDWPEDSTLVAILRDQAPITPSRDDVIDGGDELFFVTTIAAEDQLRELLSPGSGDGHGSGEGQAPGDGQASGDARARGEVPASDLSPEEGAPATPARATGGPATADQLDDDGFDG